MVTTILTIIILLYLTILFSIHAKNNIINSLKKIRKDFELYTKQDENERKHYTGLCSFISKNYKDNNRSRTVSAYISKRVVKIYGDCYINNISILQGDFEYTTKLRLDFLDNEINVELKKFKYNFIFIYYYIYI